VSEALAPVLRQINAAHGTAFALGERFPRGGQGVVRLRDAGGAGFVLKWRPGATGLGALPAEVPLLDRLRAAGYPIPRYVAWGVLAAPAGRYTVQEQLPGESAWGLSGAALEDAVALNDRQAGAGAALEAFARAAGLPPYEPWHQRLPRLAREGGDGFCLLEPMRRHSPRTAALLARLQGDIADHAAPLAARPARDVVHFDFAGPNILVAGGRITGVVDWGPLPGDRTFDLASLLFYDGYYADVAATRAQVWGRALALVDAATFGVYLAHLVHRQTDWSLRHHDAAMVERVLGIGAAVLRDLDRHRGGGRRYASGALGPKARGWVRK
jgi:Phosphotransferase enzyme family